ncbi:hypothetical protein BVI2075_780081 [Burkholderia vietnamiensis]|nr:hypothetical protein BVI2075_780081 [Burkholderia vietnamiensis]
MPPRGSGVRAGPRASRSFGMLDRVMAFSVCGWAGATPPRRCRTRSNRGRAAACDDSRFQQAPCRHAAVQYTYPSDHCTAEFTNAAPPGTARTRMAARRRPPHGNPGAARSLLTPAGIGRPYQFAGCLRRRGVVRYEICLYPAEIGADAHRPLRSVLRLRRAARVGSRVVLRRRAARRRQRDRDCAARAAGGRLRAARHARASERQCGARPRVHVERASAARQLHGRRPARPNTLSPLDRHHRRSGRARRPAGTRVRRNGRAAVRAASLRGCAAARSAVERVDRAIPLLAVLRLSARRVSKRRAVGDVPPRVRAAPAHPAFGVAAQRREPAASDARAVPATGARAERRDPPPRGCRAATQRRADACAAADRAAVGRRAPDRARESPLLRAVRPNRHRRPAADVGAARRRHRGDRARAGSGARAGALDDDRRAPRSARYRRYRRGRRARVPAALQSATAGGRARRDRQRRGGDGTRRGAREAGRGQRRARPAARRAARREPGEGPVSRGARPRAAQPVDADLARAGTDPQSRRPGHAERDCDHPAPAGPHGPADRRSARRVAHHARQDHAEEGSGAARGHRRPRGRGREPAARAAPPPSARGHGPRGALPRRPRAPVAGRREPADERGEIHAAGRRHRGARATRRGRQHADRSARQRRGHSARPPSEHLRTVLPDRRRQQAGARRPRHRPRAGAQPREPAWRHRARGQRRARPRQHVHDRAAGIPAARRRRGRAAGGVRHPRGRTRQRPARDARRRQRGRRIDARAVVARCRPRSCGRARPGDGARRVSRVSSGRRDPRHRFAGDGRLRTAAAAEGDQRSPAVRLSRADRLWPPLGSRALPRDRVRRAFRETGRPGRAASRDEPHRRARRDAQPRRSASRALSRGTVDARDRHAGRAGALATEENDDERPDRSDTRRRRARRPRRQAGQSAVRASRRPARAARSD